MDDPLPDGNYKFKIINIQRVRGLKDGKSMKFDKFEFYCIAFIISSNSCIPGLYDSSYLDSFSYRYDVETYL